jgi:hypothetical protein
MLSPMSTLKTAHNQIISPLLLEEIVQNNQKTGFCAVFFHFGAIWAPPEGAKKELKGLQVIGRYGPMSNQKNKPLTKLLVPFF